MHQNLRPESYENGKNKDKNTRQSKEVDLIKEIKI